MMRKRKSKNQNHSVKSREGNYLKAFKFLDENQILVSGVIQVYFLPSPIVEIFTPVSHEYHPDPPPFLFECLLTCGDR